MKIIMLKYSLLLLGLLQICNLKSAGVSESKEQAEAKAEATPAEKAKSSESKVKFYNSYEDYIKECKQKMGEVHKHLVADVTGIVESFACISNDQWEKNNEELERAIRQNDIGRVRKFLESGEVAINPALIAAIRSGNLEVVKLLVSHGADINVKDRDGNTLLTQVIKNIAHNVKTKDIVPPFYKSEILKAIEESKEKIRFLLSQKGINVNEKNANGLTVLTVFSMELPFGYTEEDIKIIKAVNDLLKQAGAT